MTDPFESLVEEHRMAEDLLEQLADAEPEERQDLFDQLRSALELHMAVEESVVYPVVAEALGRDEAEEAETEHGLARTGLEQVAALLPDVPGFGAALAMLQAGIDHHVQEEESEVFPSLRDKLDENRQAELAEQITAAAASGVAAPRGDKDGPTKAELLEQAKQAGISGRSSMTKDELQQALAEQR